MQAAKHGRSAWLRRLLIGFAFLASLTAALSVSSSFAKTTIRAGPAVVQPIVSTSLTSLQPIAAIETIQTRIMGTAFVTTRDIASLGDSMTTTIGDQIAGATQLSNGNIIDGTIPTDVGALTLVTITTVLALSAFVVYFGFRYIDRQTGGVFFSRRLAGSPPQSLRR